MPAPWVGISNARTLHNVVPTAITVAAKMETLAGRASHITAAPGPAHKIHLKVLLVGNSMGVNRIPGSLLIGLLACSGVLNVILSVRAISEWTARRHRRAPASISA